MDVLRDQILQQIRQTVEWEGAAWPAPDRWRTLATRLFHHQRRHHLIYRRWCRFVESEPENPEGFPGLPILAFKEANVGASRPPRRPRWFESSGTTGRSRSRHYFHSFDLYEASVIAGWAWFLRAAGRDGSPSRPRTSRSWHRDVPVGRYRPTLNPAHFRFIALTPSAAEAPHSSLAHMLATLMREFGDGRDSWGMRRGRWDWPGIARPLRAAIRQRQATVLFGTAFAWVHLLDWCRARHLRFRLPPASLALETGGYKGQSREVERGELHRAITRLLGIPARRIYSEYSMCELSSQAYATSNAIFHFPPWCRARVVHPGTSREVPHGKRGVLEIVDLANVDSCAFIRTEDLAIRRGGGFELVGRLPRAGLKGCSLIDE